MDLKRILTRLVRLRPGEPATLPLRRVASGGLLKIAEEEGLRGVERRVTDVNAKGHRFVLVARAAGTRTWREELEGGKRKIEIYVASNRSYRATALRYEKVEPLAPLTKRDRLQKRFYDRYMAIGQKSYNDPRARISAVDRRLLLVGELEADVNNGGFSQYLSNKGPRRARSALEALKAIGASKTAAMLETALKPGVSEAQLSRLDDRFYKVPEDLAILGARHAGLTE